MTPLNRRQLIQSAALLSAGIAARTLPAVVGSPQVKTGLGVLAGAELGGVRQFLGIPFAEPPVGLLRFRAPAPAKRWSGVRDATRFAPSAVQPGQREQSEDCLYLNVYTPAAPAKTPLPVFVWIHGGGFTGGSPVDTDGADFAKDGVVTVTVPYRLGVFGFLDWSPLLGPEFADSANNGLRDLVLALQWVRANIAAFGGDPARVTIGGQSAGAKMVAFLMATEEARPLFASAISESGGGERILDTAAAHRVTDAVAAQLSSRDRAAVLAMSPGALLAAQERLIAGWPANFPLRVQGGGSMLPHRAIPAITAGSSRGKRLLIGTCRDECAFYLGDKAAEPIPQKRLGNATEAQFGPVLAGYAAVYPAMSIADRNVRALTAEEYWVPSVRVAQALAKGGGGATYFYRLDEPAATGAHRGTSYHSYDIGYVFEHLASGEPAVAQTLSKEVHAAWVSFIRGGAPSAAGLPAWPVWTPGERTTMLFNAQSTVERRPFDAELHLWDGFSFA